MTLPFQRVTNLTKQILIILLLQIRFRYQFDKCFMSLFKQNAILALIRIGTLQGQYAHLLLLLERLPDNPHQFIQLNWLD
ncbi:hypothetical protein D3C87_1869420 [compost metagenome]